MPDQIPKNVLSVVIPIYNEEATLSQILERVLEQEIVGEIILVDDGSKDDTAKISREWAQREDKVNFVEHDENQGKGAALRTGFSCATKPFVIVQDADMEYDPKDFQRVIGPLAAGEADVVYGSRYLKKDPRVVMRFWHTMGNRFLTLLSNMASNLHVTDMETCYKGFRREIIQTIPIKENRFGFEPEITAKIARMKLRVIETSIHYYPRSYDEGKKIGWKDGVSAIWCIAKYNLFDREPIKWDPKNT